MKKIIFFCFVISLMLVFIPRLNADNSAYSLEDVEKGVVYSEKIDFITGEKEIYINDIYYESNICIGVGYTVKEENESEYYGYPYIVYYENGILLFTKVIENYGYGEFKRVVYCDGCFYIMGDCETDGIIKPIVMKIDEVGNIHKMICLHSDGNTIGIDMFIEKGEIFIFLSSQANYINDYEVGKAVNRLCLAKLNFDLETIWFDYYGNDGINSIYDIKYYNEYFYVYSKISGKGDFYLKKEEEVIIFGISTQGDIAFEYYVNDIIMGNSKFFVLDNDIILYNERYYDNKIEVYKISGSNMIKEKVLSVELSEKYQTIRQNFFIDIENEIFVVTHYINEGKNYLFFKSCKNSFSIMINDNKDVVNMNFSDFYYMNGFVYFKYQERINEDYLTIYKRLICIKKSGDDLYCNNNKVEGVIDNNLNPTFGKYIGVVSYSYDNVIIYVDGYVVVPLKTEIVNKGVYDIGLILEANGDMYLNNTYISQGYVVLEEGDYLLEIKGENDEKYLMFSVKRLSSDDVKEIKNVECKSIEVQGTTNERSISFLGNHNMIATENINIFLIIGLVLVSGFLIGFVIPLFIYRRKVND